jgi:hypothetical protein
MLTRSSMNGLSGVLVALLFFGSASGISGAPGTDGFGDASPGDLPGEVAPLSEPGDGEPHPCIVPAAQCYGCNPIPTSFRPRTPLYAEMGFFACEECSRCGWVFCGSVVCGCGPKLMKDVCVC